MKAQDIYHKMRAIAEDYHAYTDQLTAIAMWIEAEFEYKPQKLANSANTSEGQLTIPDVSVAKRKLCPTCGSDSLITLSDITYCMNDCCDGVKGHN